MGKMNVCMFFNDLAIYRKAIYKMLDNEYDCEWYIEDIDTKVKEFDASELGIVHRIPVKSIGPFYMVKGLLSLLKKDFEVYFVLGATRNLSLFLMCLWKRLFYPQKRIYFWTHGLYGKENKLELLFWKLPLFRLANGIFAYGEYSKKLLIEKGFDPQRVFVIHNSLAYEEQLQIRNNLFPTSLYQEHFGNNNPVLVMIGRLNMRKHLDMLIEAVSILKQKGELYNVVLIGDGEDKEKLKTITEKLDVRDQVWFYGACYDEYRNAELIYNSDLCVVPGDIGLTAIHSMMFGTPVVSHNFFPFQGPEFEAIKPGVTGDFFGHGDLNSLAGVITRWFYEHSSNREQVRLNCYNEIDTNWNPNFQMEVITKNLI